MLKTLTIQNIAIVKKTTLSFGKGLNVFTGQTGAGKSIILDSLSLCLGARADTGLIRHNEDQATVSAEFFVSENSPIFAILSEQGIALEDNMLLIRRVLSRSGQHKAFINDHPIGITLLKEISSYLIEIHKQFDRLLDSSSHRETLDNYLMSDSLISEVSCLYNKWRNTNEELQRKLSDLEKSINEKEYLQHTLKELNQFDPHPNEESILLDQRLTLKDQKGTVDAYRKALEELEKVTIQSIYSVEKNLLKAAKSEESATLKLAQSVGADITEIAEQIENKLQRIEGDHTSLEEIEDRLFSLRNLARKHQVSPDFLFEFREKINDKHEKITNSDQLLQELQKQEKETRKKFVEVAKELTLLRQRKSLELDTHVAEELPPLKLSHAKFKTEITSLNENNWGTHGCESVEFLVDTNNQGIFAPLKKIASGGEAARFMLALKVCLARVGSLPSLIFDEVDSGVGGDVAAAVGERLKRLAQKIQVFAITHSPQVAAVSDVHWKVSKDQKEAGVISSVTELNAEEKIEEVARMLSGATVTEEALSAAKKLIED